jgi:hypothetical protein
MRKTTGTDGLAGPSVPFSLFGNVHEVFDTPEPDVI